MKTINNASVLVLILLLSLFNCASGPKLQKAIPSEFKDAYFQKWNAGIKDGGSGIKIFIELNDASIQLDSIYFRESVTKLFVYPNNKNLYVGKYRFNVTRSKIPFNLSNNDCVVSYIYKEETLYFKISNLTEEMPLNYPISHPNN